MREVSVRPARRLAFSNLCRVKKRKSKAFFFDKKKQKTFAFLGACWGQVRDSEQKFFGSFFQKRTASFPCLIEVLLLRRAPAERSATANKSFLLLFFKKEGLYFSPQGLFRCGVFATCLALAASAAAETVTPPSLPPPDSWVPRQSGTLRVLNKLDSTVQAITLHVGETAKLQSLSITLQACEVRPEGLPEDSTARVTVSDSRDGQPGFDGWMLQKEPSVNMLEHPVYDIQLAGCS